MKIAYLTLLPLVFFIAVLPLNAAVLDYRIETTDVAGSPIDIVTVANDFELRIWLQDVRPSALGVLSAYLDVPYDASRLEVVPQSLNFGQFFGTAGNFDLSSPGLIDEVGSFINGTDPLGGDEMLLFSVQFKGTSLGIADFSTEMADILPLHSTTLFGLNDPLTAQDIDFASASIFVTPDGDFNDDEIYDCTDVDALVAAAASGSYNVNFDMTGDSVLDANDLDAWLAEAGANNLASGNAYFPGDADLNGTVDGQDFLAWNNNKFTNTAAWCSGDFTADGVVDGEDFLQWNSNKFTSADSLNTVPEPGAGVLLAALVVMGLARSRR